MSFQASVHFGVFLRNLRNPMMMMVVGRGGNSTLGFDGSISVISAHLTCPPSTAQEDK